ncbi:MAG: tRNA(5-methylaminomethyl-2-thiouridylate) methyltransferase [Desulfovibrio sp.]
MSTRNEQQYDALALFSGGLDSVLACKVIQKQGLRVLGLHFITPFFGSRADAKHWSEIYDVDIKAIDISQEYLQLLFGTPPNGFGKRLNPCMDCKVTMMRHAKALMARYGAKFIISGEVVGQRPMSQRRDALNVISRDGEVEKVLVRPLCAQRLDPSQPELDGHVDRDQLLGIWGRGRKEQLRLAEEFELKEIPSPAGGCLLTEEETVKRYYRIVSLSEKARVDDFYLAKVGRQLWNGKNWLVIGRNQIDNEHMENIKKDDDYTFYVKDFSGPLGLGRILSGGEEWSQEAIESACVFFSSYSPKAKKAGHPIEVSVTRNGEEQIITVTPERDLEGDWQPANLQGFKEWKVSKTPIETE